MTNGDFDSGGAGNESEWGVDAFVFRQNVTVFVLLSLGLCDVT